MEGHTTNSISHAQFRVTLGLIFRRRSEFFIPVSTNVRYASCRCGYGRGVFLKASGVCGMNGTHFFRESAKKFRAGTQWEGMTMIIQVEGGATGGSDI